MTAELNAQLVKELRAGGWLRTQRVVTALETVRRGWFVPPEFSREEAYGNEVVFISRDGDGTALSSVSAPWLVAGMLERLVPREGDRVLEIGSGGWNAALLRHLVGPDGRVTSVDIDPAVVARARRGLAGTDWQDVRVIEGDGRAGFPGDAPYDRLVVTVQASAIAPAWLDQLAPDGRMVVPLRVRGMGRLLTFTAEGGHWRGGGWEQCGFVRMRGEGADQGGGRTFRLGERARLRVHDSPLPDQAALAVAASGSRHESWSGVTVGVTERTRPLVDLWLATWLDRFGRLHADEATAGAAGPLLPLPGGSSATWDGANLAYVTMRAADATGTRYEYGVAWHGSDPQIVEKVVELLRTWDREQRGGPGPALMLYREADASPSPPGRALPGTGPRLVLTWQAQARP
ncbi:methyltransferase, FxLD system [Streptomyces sp. NPDC021020]|uniref:methyltransferase, FxLD system n=1 Tax=Streptomyces sp. NPDC021020 TaxID=3365109 RepID=UPI0037A7D542